MYYQLPLVVQVSVRLHPCRVGTERIQWYVGRRAVDSFGWIGEETVSHIFVSLVIDGLMILMLIHMFSVLSFCSS